MKQIIAIFLFIFAMTLASCGTQCDCDECCKTHCKTEEVIDSTQLTPVVDSTEVESETEK